MREVTKELYSRIIRGRLFQKENARKTSCCYCKPIRGMLTVITVSRFCVDVRKVRTGWCSLAIGAYM